MPEWLFQAAALAACAAGGYAAIRADLAALRVKVEHLAAETARANSRIDHFFNHRRA